MEISRGNGDLTAIKNAYMKARDANDLQEMSRLRTKAMAIKNSEKPSAEQKSSLSGNEGTAVIKNEDGDALEIGLATKGEKVSKDRQSTSILEDTSGALKNKDGDSLEISTNGKSTGSDV